MVIFESLLASRSFHLKPETIVLSSISRIIPILLGIYLAAKLIDMVNRETYVYLIDGTPESISFLVEIIFGVIFPMLIFSIHSLRSKSSWLFTGSTLVVLGVALNRYNVFILGFKPVYAEARYITAWTEIAVTVGLISTLVLVYRLLVMKLPVIHGFGGYKSD
jgi:Ni/Fe-hydrogenase subunit HybB-like protein